MSVGVESDCCKRVTGGSDEDEDDEDKNKRRLGEELGLKEEEEEVSDPFPAHLGPG